MADAFDRIVIAVPDLASAREEYAVLFGRALVPAGDDCAWLVLANTTIELREHDVELARVQGLVLRDGAAAAEPESFDNDLGLDLALCDGSATGQLREAAADGPIAARVDHVVLRTGDGDACIALFCDALGIRLALDKTVPQWGGRMLFFRAGKMTLEVIDSQQDGSEGDYFWGIAYQHADLDAVHAELQLRGVACSEVREGRKPGTRVATVKSHCLGLPTLLIEPAA